MNALPKVSDCRRCDNTGFVCCPCLEVEDSCVCEWNGEMPCPRCDGAAADSDLYAEDDMLEMGGEG